MVVNLRGCKLIPSGGSTKIVILGAIGVAASRNERDRRAGDCLLCYHISCAELCTIYVAVCKYTFSKVLEVYNTSTSTPYIYT